MPLNIATFEQTIAKKIASATCSSDLLFLGKAMALLRNGSVDSVAQFTDLPSAATVDRQMFLVECDNQIYVSACGRWISMQSTTRNELWAWGGNFCGRLGDGTTFPRIYPVQPLGCIADWTGVSAGCLHTLGLRNDGSIWTWGNNANGQLGNGTTTDRSSPGTLTGHGTNWCVISAGRASSSAVKTDGTLWTWGYNTYGRLGDGTSTARSSPVTTAGGGTNWSSTAAGNGHMAGIKSDGTIWTWGLNQTGQLGNGFGGFGTNRNSPVTVAGGGTTWCQVGTGLCHTSAVKTDGTLWTWGGNSVGQLGAENTTNRSSPGTTAGGGTDWCFVASSHENAQTLAIKTDGTLWSWGTNAAGQLGDGSVTCRSSPVTVAGGGTTWCTVSTTNQHSGAIKTDGTLWTWGANCCNGLGSLGNNSSSPATTTRGGNNWWKVSTTVTGGTLAIERYS